MGSIYKKSFTKPLPAGAELFERKGERFARWKGRDGKTQTAPVSASADGSLRVRLQADTWTAKYRDGSGAGREIATGCKDAQSARSVLAELERRAELVKSGIVSAQEDAMADFHNMPLGTHFEEYQNHLRAKGVAKRHPGEVKKRLERIAEECRFARIGDLNRAAFERWLVRHAGEGMSARTRNVYRATARAFGGWLVKAERVATNPFANVAPAEGETKRNRRALTEDELGRLIEAARTRPLVGFLGIMKTEEGDSGRADRAERLKPSMRARLERSGWERALAYKALALTGLRRNELASLKIGCVNLDPAGPHFVLSAADAKNRKRAEIPLRGDLAEEIGQWIAEKLRLAQDAAERAGEPIPTRLAPAERLFDGALRVKWFNADLKAAGIAKTDEHGRTLDLHCLRHTFATWLSVGGVAPRTAQAAMRHSAINLTMNTYTDSRMLDVRGALDALPSLPSARLEKTPPRGSKEVCGPVPVEASEREPQADRAAMTGTDPEPAEPKDSATRTLAPTLAPGADFSGVLWSQSDPTEGIKKNEPVLKGMKKPQENTVFLGVSSKKVLERVTGIEPVSSAWKAEALTLVLHPPVVEKGFHHNAARRRWSQAGCPRARSLGGLSWPQG